MAKISPLMILPPLIFAGFVTLAGVGMFRGDPNALPSTFIGEIAPALPTEALQGYPGVTAQDLASGEVSLINFWASWCPPCRAEHPTLMKMAADGIRIYGINIKDDPDHASGFLEKDGNPFQGVGADPKGRSAIDWGVTGPPETFIIDGQGKVLFKFIGPLVGSDLQQRFMPELEKAQAAQAAQAVQSGD